MSFAHAFIATARSRLLRLDRRFRLEWTVLLSLMVVIPLIWFFADRSIPGIAASCIVAFGHIVMNQYRQRKRHKH